MAFSRFMINEPKGPKSNVEDEIIQKMSRLPILDALIDQLFGEDFEEWITLGQSYYDNCKRVVRIEPDCFELKWSRRVRVNAREGGEAQYEEETIAERAYSFTKSGYVPLHAHCNEKGKEDVPVGQVCYLLASLIRERMMAKMNNCKFGEVQHYKEAATFTYKVPAMTFEDWF